MTRHISLEQYDPESFKRELDSVMTPIRLMLLAKNESYGNSALDPVRIFSAASPVEQLLVRIDDKLSRLARGSSLGEDTVTDLIGYLVLLKVAMARESAVRE